jgi:cellulose synthase/poly-beta-1,6-N-acetylglucosamine synthase-like glycosyltransferase
VICEPQAYALTEAPETVRGFLKQRLRWMLGTLQATVKHAGALLERPKGMALLTIPNVLLFQFGFTLAAPLMDAVLIYALLPFAIAPLTGAPTPNYGNLVIIAQYWLAFQAADLSAAAIGIRLEAERGYWRLLPLVIVQRFCYRQLLYVTAVTALLAALKGTLVGWGKLLRTGSVPSVPEVRGVRIGSSE